ncbi:DUF3846 domain-containing protein [Alkalicoccobacillus gibsonii]|uniref:DUF3846 domain-containing protein n=1 Tax=Alkalicoccobacillus gibsonii TaxID=79881 RepID=UPI00351904DC
MMAEQVKVLVVNVGEPPEEVTVSSSQLNEFFTEAVGGTVSSSAFVQGEREIRMIYNDNFISLNLENNIGLQKNPNLENYKNYIQGNVVIVAYSRLGEIRSLTDGEMHSIRQALIQRRVY